MRIFLMLLLVALAAACSKPVVKEPLPDKPVQAKPAVEQPKDDNPYSRTYSARNLHGVKLNTSDAAPKIFKGVAENEDYQRMLRDGYEMLGYSRFEAGDVPPSQALAQASSIHAEAVVVYTKLLASPTAAMKMQQIRDQAKHSDRASDSSEIYSYFATYWAKLLPPVLGVHVMKPRDGDPEPGLTVLAVIADSPAEKAGVVVGDVLVALDKAQLKSPQQLQEVTQQYAGQDVEISLRRVNLEKTVSVHLNPVP